MSNQVIDLSTANDKQLLWMKAREDLHLEIAASPTLTEKHYLLVEMNLLSDDEWEPITCLGEPISEAIIKDRGER